MNMRVSDLERELLHLRCILYDFIPNFSGKMVNKFYRELDRNGNLQIREKKNYDT